MMGWAYRSRSLGALTAVLAGLVGALGCSDGKPHRVPVSGIVKIDGKPLAGGSIMVIPAHERPAGSSIGPDGRFRLSSYELNDGVVTGTHTVTVQYTDPISERETRWLTPKKYGDPRTSGLTVTIEEPTDDVIIDLTWDGKQPFVERM